MVWKRLIEGIAGKTVVCLIALLAKMAIAGSLYKWADDTGRVHFTTEQPPLGRIYKEIQRPGQIAIACQPTSKEWELLNAIEKGEADRAAKLLNDGTDTNACDGVGRTALMYAGINGQTEVMKALVEKGADVNRWSSEGLTALQAAITYGDPEAIRLLLSKGADVNARDIYGQTALGLAQKRLKNAPPNREALSDPGRKPGLLIFHMRSGTSPAQYSTRKEFEEIIDLLKAARAEE